MKRLMIAVVGVAALVLALAGQAGAGLHQASAQTGNTVTVSGTWTVSHYKAPGCYSGLGDPQVSDWKSQGTEVNTPITLGTTKSATYGSASSSIAISGTTIDIDSAANVHDVLNAAGHWAMGYSEGGANWLLCGATGTATVTASYSYDLSLVGAKSSAEALAKVYVAFWGPSSNLLLTAKDGFLQSGNYLVKTVQLTSPGTSTGLVSGSASWDVSVTSGSYYAFWGQSDAKASTTPEPATMALMALGGVGMLLRRRRNK